MKLPIVTIFICCSFLFGCNSNSTNSSLKNIAAIEKFLPDTSKSWQAKHEFDGYMYRKRLSEKLGLGDIEKSLDSLEIRVWWQASIYSPSSVWQIRRRGDTSIATRLDYFPRHDGDAGIDSIHTFIQKPIVGNWTDYYKNIDFSTFWRMPFHYELTGNYGCVDGESVTIEILNEEKYKTVTYPCYMIYRDSVAYNNLVSLVDPITSLR